MHEVTIARNILEIAERHAPPGISHAVRSVKVRIGDLAGIVVESLSFCFSVIAEGTVAEGATLEIERVPFTVRCEKCGAVSQLDPGEYACARCGGTSVSVASGAELEVVSLEVSDGLESRP